MPRLFSAEARVLAALALSAVAIGAANDGADKEWRYYSGDNGARKYSPLDQSCSPSRRAASARLGDRSRSIGDH